MAIVHVERLGGLAGFGGMGSHVRSLGQLDVDTLPAVERQAVESLFRSRSKPADSPMRDGFFYKLSRATAAGTETVEAPESAIPAALARCVKDELV